MTFRKDAILYYELELFCIVMALSCLGLMRFLGMGFALLSAVPFVILTLVNPRLHNEYITINEAGIMCRRSGAQLWAYEWDSIAKLKRSSRFRLPSVEVIPYCKSGEMEPFSLPGHYFQLGRAARKALKQYYTGG